MGSDYDESSSGEDSSDWEEVEVKEEPQLEVEDPQTATEYTQSLNIPTEGIKITVEGQEGAFELRKKKGFDAAAHFRRKVNRRLKLVQEYMHKSHLVCLLGRGIAINRILRSETLLAVGLSVLPAAKSKAPKNIDFGYLEGFVTWYKKTYVTKSCSPKGNLKPEEILGKNKLLLQLSTMPDELSARLKMLDKNLESSEYIVYGFIVILRALSVNVRLVESYDTLPLKPPHSELLHGSSGKTGRKKKGEDIKPDLSPKPGPSSKVAKTLSKGSNSSSKKDEKPNTSKGSKTKRVPKPVSSKSATGKSPSSENSSKKDSKRQPLKRDVKRRKLSKDAYESGASSASEFEAESDSEVDSDFENKSFAKRKRKSSAPKSKKSAESKKEKSTKDKKPHPSKNFGRKMISSSESEPDEKPKSSPKRSQRQLVNTWPEVYLEEEERWVSVDIFSGKIMCDTEFELKVTQPMSYIVAYDTDGRVRDVTRRYASKWLTYTQKIRVDPKWWTRTLKPHMGRRNRKDREEDELLDQQIANQSIPGTVQELKNHPQYALARHLLKFEALYPADAQPVGFIKNEPIYPRECVKTLYSKEKWIREAKVVRIGEEPYKTVKSRPKWDKITGQRLPEKPLHLFGEWQTEDYIPPPAVDGKVPRNDYGNVELFKPTMLPKGTVHLREPGVYRIAKKLNIDAAPAVVGFEFTKGGCHPTFDGYVVCEEFADLILDAVREDQVESSKRRESKRSKIVRDRWRKVIRMVIVRRRLEKRYDMFNAQASSPKKRPASTATTSKATSQSKPKSTTTTKSNPPAKKRATETVPVPTLEPPLSTRRTLRRRK